LEKVIVTYNQFNDQVKKLAEYLKEIDFAAIYGLPRGGLPIAVHLSHLLEKPIVMSLDQFILEFGRHDTLLIVDDIVDTGVTYQKLIKDLKSKAIYYHHYFASLYFKPKRSVIRPDYYVAETDDWVVLPWEQQEELPSQYHQEKYPEVFSNRKIKYEAHKFEVETIVIPKDEGGGFESRIPELGFSVSGGQLPSD